MTRYEEIKAKSFDEMALFIDGMLNGSVCPMCDARYCSKCRVGEHTYERCSVPNYNDCLEAVELWLIEIVD